MANSGLGLYSVATEIDSLGGEYGIFPRQDLVASHPDKMADSHESDNEPSVTGCVFWFTVPLVLPSSPKSVKEVDKKTSGSKRKLDDDNVNIGGNKDDTNKTVDFEDSNKNPIKPNLTEALMKEDSSKRVRRVLVIDDSLTIRKGLSRGFQRLGFEVEEAENGLQGLKRLKSGLYDLVLLDFLMPVLDGTDVAQQFRAWEKEHRPKFHQYIIGLSAHANGTDAQKGITAGMNRFMSKPIPLKSLKDLAECKPVMDASIYLDRRYVQVICMRIYVHITLCFTNKRIPIFSHKKLCDELRSSDCSSASTSTFAKPSCLVVAKDSDQSIQSIKCIAENLGWRAITANGDGEDVLRLLKLRNWDAVFLSNEGADCVQRFRKWESRTRSNIQKHVYMLSDSSQTSLPQGFDGIISRSEPSQVRQIFEDVFKLSNTTATTIEFPNHQVKRGSGVSTSSVSSLN